MTGRFVIPNGTMSVFGDRLKAAREQADMSQSELARRADVTPQTVQAIEAGRVQSSKHLYRFAEILKKSPGWLAGRSAGSLTEPSPSPYATVRGLVAAGLWQADSGYQGDETPVPASPDPRFARLPQIAFRVVGNSMNRVVADGEYVICVDYDASPMPLREGDIVVAERRRAGEIERTVKRVRVTRKGTELWPESNDPAFQDVLLLGSAEEDTEVVVIGIVIGYFRSA